MHATPSAARWGAAPAAPRVLRCSPTPLKRLLPPHADFAAKHGIVCEIERIKIDDVNKVGPLTLPQFQAHVLGTAAARCRVRGRIRKGRPALTRRPPHRPPAQAMERLVRNDVHYRFVIDIAASLVA